jgi:hypothetical protein
MDGRTHEGRRRADATAERRAIRRARQNYSPTGDRGQGGDMGLVHRGSLSQDFEKVAASSPRGEPSAIVETIYGYHIIRVTEVLPPRARSFADVGVRLQKDLTDERCASTKTAWTERLRAAATIAYFDECPHVRVGTGDVPAVASAQSSVSGTAEWTVAETANTTDSQANSNGAFWQNYTLGFHSSIVDPRLLKYDTEVSFRTNWLTAAGSNLADQHGKQDDLGFRVGAFVLQAGAFPFFVQASRVFAGSAGELAVANTARGGLAPQTGASLNAFETENRNLNMGGSVNLAGLPRAEIAYRRGTAITTGGLERAEQRDDDPVGQPVREPRDEASPGYQRTGMNTRSRKPSRNALTAWTTTSPRPSGTRPVGHAGGAARHICGVEPAGRADRPWRSALRAAADRRSIEQPLRHERDQLRAEQPHRRPAQRHVGSAALRGGGHGRGPRHRLVACRGRARFGPQRRGHVGLARADHRRPRDASEDGERRAVFRTAAARAGSMAA